MANLEHSTEVGVRGSDLGKEIVSSRDTNRRGRFYSAGKAPFDASRRGKKVLKSSRVTIRRRRVAIVGTGGGRRACVVTLLDPSLRVGREKKKDQCEDNRWDE